MLRSGKYDYFHIQQTDDPRFLLPAYRLPTVLTLHEPAARLGVKLHAGLRKTLRQAYSHIADVIVVHTHSGYTALSQLEQRKAVIIPHGVHQLTLQPPMSSKTILFFGKAAAYKGIDTLLAAMEEVWEFEPDAKLQILASPGGEESKYSISDPRVAATWNGFSNSELSIALSRAHVICLPYTSVSGSGVGALAHGSGRPIVASNLAGLRELVNHDEFLARPGSVTDLARALRSALARHHDEQPISPNRTWPGVATAHLDAYRLAVLERRMRGFASARSMVGRR